MVNNYMFVALSKDKKKIKGKVEASSVDELRMIINFHDYYLIKYKKLKKVDRKFIEKSIKPKDVKDLCKNMAMMLKTGQSLISVLQIIESTTNNKTLKDMLNFTVIEMTNGQSFTSCIKKYKKYFSNMFISMIEIGEKSSNLIDVFEYLSKYYDNQSKIRSKIINAMFYPLILLFLSVVIVFVMCLFVLPMYEGIFVENNIELPIVTKILFGFSGFVNDYLMFVIVGLVLLILVSILFFTSQLGKKFISSVLSKLPFIRNVYKTINIYMVASSLEIMLVNKLSIIDSMNILVNSLNDRYLIRKFKWVSDEVRRGQNLSTSLESFNYFPKMFIEMIRNGENSNQLELEAKAASLYYFQKVNDILTKVTVFIEPLLIIFISIFVGGIMASVFLPMLSLLSSIG